MEQGAWDTQCAGDTDLDTELNNSVVGVEVCAGCGGQCYFPYLLVPSTWRRLPS